MVIEHVVSIQIEVFYHLLEVLRFQLTEAILSLELGECVRTKET
jgi:hypothetical protein